MVFVSNAVVGEEEANPRKSEVRVRSGWGQGGGLVGEE